MKFKGHDKVVDYQYKCHKVLCRNMCTRSINAYVHVLLRARTFLLCMRMYVHRSLPKFGGPLVCHELKFQIS